MTSLDETAERVSNENEKVKELQSRKTREMNSAKFSLVGARVDYKAIRLL